MQKIRIDFDNPGLPQHISAVENDSQSRFFQATLYENGKAYTAPEGATYSIMYRGFGPQNQGWYDTINDGAGKRAACAVSGNVVTCEIARQALQVPGHVSIVLCVTTRKGYMLKSWPIECDCKNDRYDSTAEIQSFFYVTQISNESWTQAIQAVEELKNTIDPTLSLSGKAADAKATGDAVGELKEDLVNETNRATNRENEIEELFTMPTQEAVNTWLDAHPEATTTVQDHSLTIDKMVIGTLGYATPEMFGAVGDGATDDTEAIQLALDSNFDVVFNKSYLVTNTITLSKPKSIRGKGNIIGNFNNEKSIIYVRSNNVTVKGIYLTSNGYSTGSGNKGAIHADGIENLIIDSVKVDKFNGNAIYITSSRNCKVQNCKLTNLHDNGIFIGGSNSNNNTIENNYVDTTIAQNGIFITASPRSTETNDYIYNNTIKNNIVKNAGDTNIESGIHSVNTRIISNNCYGGHNPCILIRDNKNTLIENNYIDTKNHAISLLQQTENVTYINNGIINNNFIKNSSVGVSIQQSGFIITNNNISATETIRFAGDSLGLKNITIKNNILDGSFVNNYGSADYKLENVYIELLSYMLLTSYRTSYKNVTYKQINVIDTMERYNTTAYLKNISNKKGFVEVSITDSNGAFKALFKIDGSTSKVYGDSELHGQNDSAGFEGYNVTITNDELEIQRRGDTVTNVSMIINFTFA